MKYHNLEVKQIPAIPKLRPGLKWLTGEPYLPSNEYFSQLTIMRDVYKAISYRRKSMFKFFSVLNVNDLGLMFLTILSSFFGGRVSIYFHKSYLNKLIVQPKTRQTMHWVSQNKMKITTRIDYVCIYIYIYIYMYYIYIQVYININTATFLQ